MAELTARHRDEKAHELDDERLIEAKLGAHGGKIRFGGVHRQQQGNGIAR